MVHRRSLRDRKRLVLSCEVVEQTEESAILKITGESGIYIKELIHGDDGRTVPNLASSLGTTCHVKALDVVWIHDMNTEDDDNESNGNIIYQDGSV